MTNFPRWSDVRADVVAEAGGEEAVAKARKRNQAYIDGHRLAERRKTLGLSQTDVADQMGGGQIQISAVFGDDLYTLRGTDTHAA